MKNLSGFNFHFTVSVMNSKFYPLLQNFNYITILFLFVRDLSKNSLGLAADQAMIRIAVTFELLDLQTYLC